MSFLRGVGAGKEGAYFYRESKQAVTRLLDNPPSPSDHSPPSSDQNSQADVLPEVLKHSLPLKPDSTSSPSHFSTSKWSLRFDPNSSSASFSRLSINPLTSNLSFPQVPLGSKRWKLPPPKESVLASTANELRKDRKDLRLNPEKLKAVAEGLSLLGKAFVVASVDKYYTRSENTCRKNEVTNLLSWHNCNRFPASFLDDSRAAYSDI